MFSLVCCTREIRYLLLFFLFLFLQFIRHSLFFCCFSCFFFSLYTACQETTRVFFSPNSFFFILSPDFTFWWNLSPFLSPVNYSLFLKLFLLPPTQIFCFSYIFCYIYVTSFLSVCDVNELCFVCFISKPEGRDPKVFHSLQNTSKKLRFKIVICFKRAANRIFFSNRRQTLHNLF